MKSTIKILGFIAVLTGILIYISGCSGNHGENHETSHQEEIHDHDENAELLHASVYQCPMKCEGDKTYEKEGTCPKCGMDLEKMEIHEVEHDHSEHEHGDEQHEHDNDEHDHEHEEEGEHDHEGHSH